MELVCIKAPGAHFIDEIQTEILAGIADTLWDPVFP